MSALLGCCKDSDTLVYTCINICIKRLRSTLDVFLRIRTHRKAAKYLYSQHTLDIRVCVYVLADTYKYALRILIDFLWR